MKYHYTKDIYGNPHLFDELVVDDKGEVITQCKRKKDAERIVKVLNEAKRMAKTKKE
jgi:hypothetical protein